MRGCIVKVNSYITYEVAFLSVWVCCTYYVNALTKF